MDVETSLSSSGGIELEVGLRYHTRIDFDRKGLRRALVKGAAEVRKAARRLISRNAISAPGEFPGVDTGAMKRAIGIVSRGSKGGWIKVGVKTIKGSLFYPAVLYYGSAKRNIAPRGNYITAALAEVAPSVRQNVRAALADCLVPR